MFIYLERDRKRVHVLACTSWGGAERERGRERISSRLCADNKEPDVGLDPMTVRS